MMRGADEGFCRAGQPGPADDWLTGESARTCAEVHPLRIGSSTLHAGTCRYLISHHPVVEQKILAELDSLELLRSSTRLTPRELTYADLSKLTYLNAVIKVLHHRLS